MDSNTNAFLQTIGTLESGNNYNALYGGGTFSDYSTFPVWAGVLVDGRMTHAAGKYQFQPATWAAMQAQLNLPDFSPASQDQAAAQLIINKGAGGAIQNGDTTTAVNILSGTWQSLQTNPITTINNTFVNNGGTIGQPGVQQGTDILTTIKSITDGSQMLPGGGTIDNTTLIVITLTLLLLIIGWVFVKLRKR